jgi:hypothetical protein
MNRFSNPWSKPALRSTWLTRRWHGAPRRTASPDQPVIAGLLNFIADLCRNEIAIGSIARSAADW